MKAILTILFISVFHIIVNAQANNQRAQNPDELGTLVFKSFQNENYMAFENCIFTENDCEIMCNKANATDSVKAIVVKQMQGLTERIRRLSKENFQEIVEKGKQKGIDWPHSKLSKTFFEIRKDHNIESCDIVLLCECKDTIFGIKLDNCSKSDAWLMMGQVAIKFKKDKI